MISVIIPVYNVAPYLDACVSSVLAQTYQNFEIIMVDDGSTDGSGSRCDYWASFDERIRVIHKSNGGLSDARNAALDVAAGRYISFVDSDDVIMPAMFQILRDRMREDDLDVAVGNVLVNDLQTGKRRLYSPLSSFCNANEACTVMDCHRILDAMFNVAACNKLYRRALFDRLRFKKGIKFEDVHVWTAILFSGARIGCVDKEVYVYNVNRPGSIVATADYSGYPFAWSVQFAGLTKSGRCTSCMEADFVARITMKFIQAYVRSSGMCRKELYANMQDLLRAIGKIRMSTELNFFLSFVVFLHAWACRTLPFGAYRLAVYAESIIGIPSLNALLCKVLQGGRTYCTNDFNNIVRKDAEDVPIC